MFHVRTYDPFGTYDSFEDLCCCCTIVPFGGLCSIWGPMLQLRACAPLDDICYIWGSLLHLETYASFGNYVLFETHGPFEDLLSILGPFDDLLSIWGPFEDHSSTWATFVIWGQKAAEASKVARKSFLWNPHAKNRGRSKTEQNKSRRWVMWGRHCRLRGVGSAGNCIRYGKVGASLLRTSILLRDLKKNIVRTFRKSQWTNKLIYHSFECNTLNQWTGWLLYHIKWRMV